MPKDEERKEEKKEQCQGGSIPERREIKASAYDFAVVQPLEVFFRLRCDGRLSGAIGLDVAFSEGSGIDHAG